MIIEKDTENRCYKVIPIIALGVLVVCNLCKFKRGEP